MTHIRFRHNYIVRATRRRKGSGDWGRGRFHRSGRPTAPHSHGRFRRFHHKSVCHAFVGQRRLVRDPEGQATARHVPHTVECVAVSCAALPPRLGESTSAALAWLEGYYPRIEFARTTVGA